MDEMTHEHSIRMSYHPKRYKQQLELLCSVLGTVFCALLFTFHFTELRTIRIGSIKSKTEESHHTQSQQLWKTKDIRHKAKNTFQNEENRWPSKGEQKIRFNSHQTMANILPFFVYLLFFGFKQPL